MNLGRGESGELMFTMGLKGQQSCHARARLCTRGRAGATPPTLVGMCTFAWPTAATTMSGTATPPAWRRIMQAKNAASQA